MSQEIRRGPSSSDGLTSELGGLVTLRAPPVKEILRMQDEQYVVDRETGKSVTVAASTGVCR